MSTKKQLLDPIGTMCKLVGLNFTKVKTKIKIHNHVLSLDKPSDLQFLFRWYNEDSKDNTCELYYVITRIIKWYMIEVKSSSSSSSSIIPYTETSSSSSSQDTTNKSLLLSKCAEFIKMVNYMCDALTKLQKTYQFGNVVLAIQFYINLLQDAISGRFDDKLLPMCVLKTDEEYNNLLDYEKIKNLWDTTKIKRVCDLYDNCFAVDNDEKEDPNIKDALIDGYLRSIDAILTVTDNEFQGLIKNSNKG